MARQTIISVLNTLAMRPVDTGRPARYHAGHLDTEWQKDLIHSFQTEAFYLQKVEKGNRFRFQAKVTANITHTLKVLDCKGKTVLVIDQSATYDRTGDVTPDGTQLHTYHYRLANLSALADGVYYFLFDVNYDGTFSYQAVSEPVHVAAIHPDTVLIEYGHSTNLKDILFEQLPVRFALSVEAYIDAFTPKSVATVFEEQGQSFDQLDRTAYRSWKLFIGETDGGVADWMLDKLNHIFDCDTIYLNGKQYRIAGDTWNVPAAASYPLKSADIELREAINGEGFKATDKNLKVFTAPAPPYALGNVYVDSYVVAPAAVITSSGDETALITALNAAAQNFELFGTFVKVGSDIVYQAAAGENFTSAGALVLTTHFDLTFTYGGGVAPYDLSFDIRGGAVVIGWGHGTPELWSAGRFSPVTALHSYPSGPGTYTIKIWGSLEYIAATDTHLSGLTGTLPTQLKVLSMQGTPFASNTFNFATLAPCAANLQTLALIGCGLTAANNMPVYSFPKLKSMNLSGNALSTTVMNLVIQDVWNNAFANTIQNGYLNVAFQTTGATLNATGNLNKSKLQLNGWTVQP